MLDRYAVLGNPVEHSKSPQIHRLFAKQTGEQVEYQAIKLEAENFDSFVSAFFEEGGAGLNITVPFKELAFELAVNKSVRATLAGAVNTLLLDKQGELFGENTDGPGLVRDIQDNHQFQIKGKKILILGAGGAVRGALAALIEVEPDSICIVNRTLSRANQIVEDFKEFADITASDYESFSEEGFDLIINGTSMSLAGELPPIQGSALSEKCCCYDMMYADTDTPFVHWAKEQGATLAIDGLGMLVEQAAEAFWLWRGVRPETAPVIAALRA